MEELKDILQLLNLWWEDGKISEELAKPYRRDVFSEILEVLNYRQIIILSGLRRVGKTTLLYQTIDHLLRKISSNHILYFNFDKKVGEITEIFDVYEDLMDINWKKEKIFVFFDEITKLDGWASKIKLIYDAFPNIKFIVSSSSSVGLEEAAIRDLAGRYFLMNIKPLSFKEYLELRGEGKILKNVKLWERQIKKELKNYVLKSFPEIVGWENELLIKDYLRSTIIDKIIKQDLIEKFENVNRDLLLNLLEIFYSEPGRYLDYDSISKKLRISKRTLFQHIYYLEFSYLLRRIRNFRVSKFSVSRKMQRVYPYWWTIACCYTDNYDLLMENIIASSMDAQYYWRKNGKEIDFLKIDKKKILPIEVKNKKEIQKNELKSMKYFLEKFKINKGVVVYNGKEDEIKMDAKRKIELVPLWKVLLEKNGFSK